ncbi:hypothetical protein [Acinetobacter baumannii]
MTGPWGVGKTFLEKVYRKE